MRGLGEVRGGLGGLKGAKRGLLDPLRALFAPLEVLYGTKFSSNHLIMVQLANVNKVSITDPVSDIRGPSCGHFMSKTSRFEAPNSPESGILAAKMFIRWPKFGQIWSRIPVWSILDQILSIWAI